MKAPSGLARPISTTMYSVHCRMPLTVIAKKSPVSEERSEGRRRVRRKGARRSRTSSSRLHLLAQAIAQDDQADRRCEQDDRQNQAHQIHSLRLSGRGLELSCLAPT